MKPFTRASNLRVCMLKHDKVRALQPINIFLWALATPGIHNLKQIPESKFNLFSDMCLKKPPWWFFYFRNISYNDGMGIIFWKKEKISTGGLGEELAAKFLKKKGYAILEKNFQNPYGKRLGEIDIIAKNKNEIVFIEVKTRTLENYAGSLPEESITPAKLHKLCKIANFYLKKSGLSDSPYRFDAISVWISRDHQQHKLKHIEHIFI